MVTCSRHSGIGECTKRKKQEKTLHFLLLYFSASECLEQFIISSIARPFLSGTVKCRLIYTLYIDSMV